MSIEINPKMIALAREFHGFTQIELADKINISQSYFSRIERGDVLVTDEIIEKLVKELPGFKASFFMNRSVVLPLDTYYRKSKIIDHKKKQKAEALMNIYKFVLEELLKHIDLSTSEILSLSNQYYESPTKIANYLRSHWGIGKGRIDDITALVESKGIMVIKIDFGTEKIDGRTVVTETGHPIIFINNKLSGDRERLTIAHELGHIALHISNGLFFVQNEEAEAFTFGSEFLMPLNEYRHLLNDKLSLEVLADLKRMWKVSMQSILVRAERESLVSKRRCKYLWIEISRAGWRKGEPIIIHNERPSLFTRMLELYRNHFGYTITDFEDIFGLSGELLGNIFIEDKAKLRIAG